jgi:hypothetical protein
VGRPIAAPLDRCAELLGVDLASLREVAAKVEPYIRADGARIWSLMQLERQLRPEAYRRRRGGYLDRRRIPAADVQQWAGEGARSILRSASLSGIEGSALCGAAFSQVVAERQGRRDAF